MKKSHVVRIPDELAMRIDQYQKNIGVKMPRMAVMRNFAEEAILPRESFVDGLQRLNEGSKRKRL